jgi:hypothetical protein
VGCREGVDAVEKRKNSGSAYQNMFSSVLVIKVSPVAMKWDSIFVYTIKAN